MNFTTEVLATTASRARMIASDWRAEVPTAMTTSQIGCDGNPAWHPDFDRWLTRSDGRRRGSEDRIRTTRAMRRLRSLAPRMFEVSYRLLLLGESVDGCTGWLNERAKRNAIPLPKGRTVHYCPKDTIAILIGTTDFVAAQLESGF